MKRLLTLLLILLLSLSVLVACTVPSGGNDGNTDGGYTYTAFTSGEKAKLTALVGEVIPFIPNNEYYFDLLSDELGDYISFYTYGNTSEEFENYLASFDGYTLAGTEADENGAIWYYYEKGDFCVDISYYATDYSYTVDVYVYPASDLSDGGNDNGSGGGSTDKLYNAFTSTEIETFTALVGEVIPFIPNNEYYLETSSDEYGTYINFYTCGNTGADFTAYQGLLVASGYTLDDTQTDEYGDLWYCYSKGDICIDASYYEYDGDRVIDLYVYLYSAGDDTGNEGSGGGGGNENGSASTSKTYNSFTSAEKNTIISVIGEVLPFLPNNEYYVDEDSDEYGPFINFYTYGNTSSEFSAYRNSLVSFGYVLDDTDTDEYGDLWYYYCKGDICIELSYYETYDGYVVDLYAYIYSEDESDNEGSGTGSGGDAYPDGYDVITNDGAGLPSDADGVYDVDFTGATNVKDVTDQGYYLDGCPTTGSPAVLVIPVEFSDVTAKSKGYDIATLYSAFASNDPNDGFYSVYEYYNISSYGQLALDFTILDNWFKPSKTSSYYASSTDSDGYLNGDQIIIDEALAYLSTIMDLSAFDSDGNGIIDAVVIVHTLDVDERKDFYWAYRYWNYYTDSDGYYYEYDGVSANDYLWASFAFLYESYDENGDPVYTDKTVMNTYTFIHEFGHILGADDYYDTSYSGDESPLMGMDIMDGMFGDHNAFTKFNYGWITTSRLVVTEGSVTLSLEAFAKTGDTIIIANNWDESLGAYQEYYVIVYYTADGLNAGEDAGYFLRDGIVVYHVNASLLREVYEGEVYYDIYNNNTDPSDEYGTVNNLIEYVTSASGNYTYVAGDTMSTVYDDAGNPLTYNFVVDSIDGDTATITFTKG